MMPSPRNSPYSKTVNGIRQGSNYRPVNEQKSNVTATSIKRIHQARKQRMEYPMTEISPARHHHDFHDHREHRDRHDIHDHHDSHDIHDLHNRRDHHDRHDRHDHHDHQRHHQHHPPISDQSAIRSMDTILSQSIPKMRTTSASRQCSNCCGGLPGRGPGSGLLSKSKQPVTGQCCCQNEACSSVRQVSGGCSGTTSVARSICLDEKRLRGGGSTTRFSYTKNFLQPPIEITHQDPNGYENENLEEISKTDNPNIRIRGGCGSPQGIQPYYGCDFASRNQCPPLPCTSAYKYPRRRPNPCPPSFPVYFARQDICCREDPCAPAKACCPCGGCGGPACSDNLGGGQIDAGCCGSGRVRGLPCKCKCQSCKDFHPCGGCGGQSCGKIYSCAGSSGGTCCFPRNYKRRAGSECCGGGNSGCGGCC